MYSYSNWGLCFSGFLHWLHDSQKSVLAYDKHGKLAAGIRVQPRELELFPCKVSCAMNGKIRGCVSFSHRSWSFEFTRAAQMPVQPAIPSPLVLETVPSVENSSCCNNTTKNQVFLGRFRFGITGLRCATRRTLSPSLQVRASPVTDVGSQHAHTLARKNERRA